VSSTNTRLQTLLRRSALPVLAIGVMTLAGCGSDGDSSTEAGDTSGSTGTTVSIRDAGDDQVLATSGGLTLYVSDQEQGEVLCASSACEEVWVPLTVPSGEQPSAPEDFAGELGTVERPDGSSQVALEGQPLYTFSFDHAAGDVNGDGETDSFDGVDFTWHVATPTGEAPAPSDDGGGFDY
jgi:predicted lipoprotein with Yx(FWY)xxD motif